MTMAPSPGPRWNARPCRRSWPMCEPARSILVVVYKVDRLTRSLADFAKLIELFEAHSVSFVSVTQSFNTSSSMGRLTLNVLLSFAQFEREVIGERVRDKIAASKRKGIWVGGPVPLGYAAVDKKIVVVPAEAEAVRTIFARYLELGSVRALAEDLDRQRHPQQAATALEWPNHRRRRLRGGGARLSAQEPVLHRRGGLPRRGPSGRPRADPRSAAVRRRAGQACGPGRGAALPAARLARSPDRAPVRRSRATA